MITDDADVQNICVQLRLPDGSLCCPTKPIPTALPPVPPNDAPLTWPQYMNARCQFNIQGNGNYAELTSVSIVCETADGTDVLMYMGPTMLMFAANFQGTLCNRNFVQFIHS